MISIRQSTEEDTSLILKFINQLAHYEKLSDEVVATEDKIKKYLFGSEKVAVA